MSSLYLAGWSCCLPAPRAAPLTASWWLPCPAFKAPPHPCNTAYYSAKDSRGPCADFLSFLSLERPVLQICFANTLPKLTLSSTHQVPWDPPACCATMKTGAPQTMPSFLSFTGHRHSRALPSAGARSGLSPPSPVSRVGGLANWVTASSSSLPLHQGTSPFLSNLLAKGIHTLSTMWVTNTHVLFATLF